MKLIPAHDFVKLGVQPGMLVKDVLPVHSIMLLSGEPFVGKSLVALDIALAVAGAQDFMERKSRGGNVIYVGLDSPRWDLALQMKKLAAARKLEMDEDFPLWFFPGYDLRPLHNDDSTRQTIELIKQKDASLIVMDTLRMVQLRDENHAGDMAAVMARARIISDEGCSVILLHHASKPQGEQKRSAGSSARGSGVIAASCDVHWVLGDSGTYTHTAEIGEGPRVEVKVAKGRGLGKTGRRGFLFGIVEPVPDQQVFLHRIAGAVPIDQDAKPSRFARLPGA